MCETCHVCTAYFYTNRLKVCWRVSNHFTLRIEGCCLWTASYYTKKLRFHLVSIESCPPSMSIFFVHSDYSGYEHTLFLFFFYRFIDAKFSNVDWFSGRGMLRFIPIYYHMVTGDMWTAHRQTTAFFCTHQFTVSRPLTMPNLYTVAQSSAQLCRQYPLEWHLTIRGIARFCACQMYVTGRLLLRTQCMYNTHTHTLQKVP